MTFILNKWRGMWTPIKSHCYQNNRKTQNTKIHWFSILFFRVLYKVYENCFGSSVMFIYSRLLHAKRAKETMLLAFNARRASPSFQEDIAPASEIIFITIINQNQRKTFPIISISRPLVAHFPPPRKEAQYLSDFLYNIVYRNLYHHLWYGFDVWSTIWIRYNKIMIFHCHCE